MIKCNEVINELEAYRRDETAPELKALIASHLGACPACQSELKALEQLDTLLDAYQVAPATGNLQAGLNQKIDKLERAYRFHLGWRRVGLLASAAVVMVAALVWLVNPFNGSDTEIIANIELLEDMETAQVADIVQDYELVEAMPEIMDADLNGE
ncbi:MAG: zf-HC2 domain-containing protein [Planctomycetes bacterium]|nr:zf-HC2 domain-containing protein [Planctomycetota bacterium]